MSRLGAALQEELNGTSPVLSVSVDALSTVEVIEDYAMVAPSWLLGPWDSSSCSCTAGAEVATLRCSRGAPELCEGPAARWAGPRPETSRPCAACPLPVWLLPVGLLSCCCCALLGCCLGRQALRLLFPKLNERFKERMRAVQSAVHSARSRASDVSTEMPFIKRLSVRPIFTVRSGCGPQNASKCPTKGSFDDVLMIFGCATLISGSRATVRTRCKPPRLKSRGCLAPFLAQEPVAGIWMRMAGWW